MKRGLPRAKSRRFTLSNSKGFTLIELLVVITILGILATIGLNSFTSAQKKSRDAKRKGHLKQIADALESYANDNSNNEYPDDGSDSGNIYGCGEDAEDECVWGETAFSNTTTDTIYMLEMPNDPTTGFTYYYDATGSIVRNYILCARLENTNDISVPKDASNNPQTYDDTNCTGDNDTCNYCISSPNQSLPTTDTDPL